LDSTLARENFTVLPHPYVFVGDECRVSAAVAMNGAAPRSASRAFDGRIAEAGIDLAVKQRSGEKVRPDGIRSTIRNVLH
jgi:hypothetical protein